MPKVTQLPPILITLKNVSGSSIYLDAKTNPHLDQHYFLPNS